MIEHIHEGAAHAGSSLLEALGVHRHGVADGAPWLVVNQGVSHVGRDRLASNEGADGSSKGDDEGCSL